MNFLVYENFTALLREESTIEALLATLKFSAFLVDYQTIQHEQLLWAFRIHPLESCSSLCQ